MEELIKIQSGFFKNRHYGSEKIPINIKPSKNPAVYYIENPLHQRYVGSSKNIWQRYHQYCGNSFKGQWKLKESFNKFGKTNHKFVIIAFCEEQCLHGLERYYSEKFNVLSKQGLNSAITGDEFNVAIFSDETRAKISRGNKGKFISEAQRIATSLRFKNKKQTIEHINKRKMFGDKNPMFGKIPKHAKPVIDTSTGIVYPCCRVAANAVGMKPNILQSMVRGSQKNKTSFIYYNE